MPHPEPTPASAGTLPSVRYPCDSPRRNHLQQTHPFATDLHASIAFHTIWRDAAVMRDEGLATTADRTAAESTATKEKHTP